MNAKAINKIIEDLDKRFEEDCLYEANVQREFIILRQDEIKKLNREEVCKVLRGLLQEIKEYVSMFSQRCKWMAWYEISDYIIWEMFQDKEDDDIVMSFMKRMDI